MSGFMGSLFLLSSRATKPKGQQHMKWTRDEAHPLLQIRSLIASNEWENRWLSYADPLLVKIAA